MKIVAINPPVEDFTAYNLWALPIGLLRVMEYHKNIGDEVQYLDFLDGNDIGDEQAVPPAYRSWGRHSYWKREIKKPKELAFVPRNYNRFGASQGKVIELLQKINVPDKFFISTGMTYWYRSVLDTIKTVKTVFPETSISVGGIAATLMPHFFEVEGVEVIKGKYEIPENITGTDIDFLQQSKFFPLNIVEGCPNRCLYCSSALIHPDVKIKNIEQQAENLEKWSNKTGLTDAAFYDDALLLEKGKYLKEFLSRLEPGKYRFHTPNGLHLKEVDKELCAILKKHNFMQLRFGFETMENRFDQKTDSNQLEKVLKMLYEEGFSRDSLGVYLLCGLPGQKVDEVERTIDFVYEVGGRPYLSEFSPVPGTYLFKKHLAESSLDFEKEPLYQNNSVSAWRSPVFNRMLIGSLKKKIDSIYKNRIIN